MFTIECRTIFSVRLKTCQPSKSLHGRLLHSGGALTCLMVAPHPLIVIPVCRYDSASAQLPCLFECVLLAHPPIAARRIFIEVTTEVTILNEGFDLRARVGPLTSDTRA